MHHNVGSQGKRWYHNLYSKTDFFKSGFLLLFCITSIVPENVQAFGKAKRKPGQEIINDLEDWYKHNTSNFELRPDFHVNARIVSNRLENRPLYGNQALDIWEPEPSQLFLCPQ